MSVLRSEGDAKDKSPNTPTGRRLFQICHLGICLAFLFCWAVSQASPLNVLKKCQTIVHNARAYRILKKVHQGLCLYYRGHGETTEQGCYILLGRRMLAQFGFFKGEDGHHMDLVFQDWKKEFHVHVDASCIALGAVLT